MEKHQKRNKALEIAIQEAHRDTDAASLQIVELKKQAENMVDNSLTACRVAYKTGREDHKQESDRLVGELQNIAGISRWALAAGIDYDRAEKEWNAGTQQARDIYMAGLPGFIEKRNHEQPHPPRAEGDLAPPGDAAGYAASVSAPARLVSHCSGSACSYSWNRNCICICAKCEDAKARDH